MSSWLIIGGGVHGTIIAHALIRRAGLPVDRITVIDPHPSPLAVWHKRVAQCGMRFLRSPAAHCLEPEFTALLRWGRHNGFSPTEHTIPPYARPSVELFAAHATRSVEESGISGRMRTDTVVAIEPGGSGWQVLGSSGRRYTADRVVLAVGRSVLNPEQNARPPLRIPHWADPFTPELVHHVYADSFSRKRAMKSHRPTVIGGGVSAAHLALALGRSDRPVTLVTRHPLHESQFDSDPCFIGPKCYPLFANESNYSERRGIISRARNPGSIPGDLATEIADAVAAGRLTVQVDEVQNARTHSSGTALLIGGKAGFVTDFCALATGFEEDIPGRTLLESIESSIGRTLPRMADGQPVPSQTLEWAPGLYLTGILGELELGPTAPNIIGAHNAAKRIVGTLLGSNWRTPRSWRAYAPETASSSSGVL